MFRVLKSIFASFVALASCVSLAEVRFQSNAPSEAESLLYPIICWSETKASPTAPTSTITMHYLQLDLQNQRYKLSAFAGATPSNGDPYESVLEKPESYFARNSAVAAINTNAFQTPTRWSDGQQVDICGLFVENGEVVSPMEDIRHAFWIDKSGNPSIGTPTDIDDVETAVADWNHAVLTAHGQLIQGGVDISVDGEPAQKHPRTGIGFDATGRFVTMIVVDGRGSNDSIGVTLSEFAGLFIGCGCSEAINMDGGGSSIMMAQDGDTTRTVNVPSDNGISRSIPCMIGIIDTNEVISKDYYVDVDGDDAGDGSKESPFATIYRAVTAIESDDDLVGDDDKATIYVGAGEFVESNQITLNKGTTLNIVGAGKAATTVDRNFGRFLYIDNGTTTAPKVVLKNFTLKNCKGTGSIYYTTTEAFLEAENMLFLDCSSTGEGGGIYYNGIDRTSTLVVNNCTFENITAGSVGGVLYLKNNTVATVINSTFNNCGGNFDWGPVIYGRGPTTYIKVINCTISNCYGGSLTANGGMLTSYDNGNIYALNNVFVNNKARNQTNPASDITSNNADKVRVYKTWYENSRNSSAAVIVDCVTTPYTANDLIYENGMFTLAAGTPAYQTAAVAWRNDEGSDGDMSNDKFYYHNGAEYIDITTGDAVTRPATAVAISTSQNGVARGNDMGAYQSSVDAYAVGSTETHTKVSTAVAAIEADATVVPGETVTINIAAETITETAEITIGAALTKEVTLEIVGAGKTSTIIDRGSAGRFMSSNNLHPVIVKDLTVQNCTGAGSIFYTPDYGNFTAENVLFSNCSNNSNGGGIFYNTANAGSTCVVNSCTFDNVSSTGGVGGAIYLYNNVKLSILNSTFNNCGAGGTWGPVIYGRGSSVTINVINSTISECYGGSSIDGGMVCSHSGALVHVVNSIIVNNNVTSGKTGDDIGGETDAIKVYESWYESVKALNAPSVSGGFSDSYNNELTYELGGYFSLADDSYASAYGVIVWRDDVGNDGDLSNDEFYFYNGTDYTKISGDAPVTGPLPTSAVAITESQNGVERPTEVVMTSSGPSNPVSMGSYQVVTYTPAIGGLNVVQEEKTVTWTIETQDGVVEYIVTDAAGNEFSVPVEQGRTEYDYTVGVDGDITLTVIDYSGYTQIFLPADANVVQVVYDLLEGWNLIAITGENANISELGVLWGWNGESYEIEAEPVAGQAVWVYSASPEVVQVIVEVDKSDAILELNTGWNMVGPTVNMTVPNEAHAVYCWADTDTYQAIAAEGTLSRGVGYWIFVDR